MQGELFRTVKTHYTTHSGHLVLCYESTKLVTDLVVIKVGLGEFSRGHLVPPGTLGQGQGSVLLSLLVVTCLNSSSKSSAIIKMHGFSQPLLGNVKTRRESLSHAGKCESFSNERDSNHSCGNLEFKLTSYQPETHLEPRVYLPNDSLRFTDLSDNFCWNDRILAAIPVIPTCCIGLPQV